MAARVGNTNNLNSNDRYDLLTFDFPMGYPNSNLKFTFGNIPRKITGVQKVAQVFLKCLLTSKGSDLLNPNQGTSLAEFLRYSNITTDSASELYSILRASVQDAVDQAKYILNIPGTSKESQIDSADIKHVKAYDEGFHVIIRLVTRAGVEAPIAVPFNSTGLTINE